MAPSKLKLHNKTGKLKKIEAKAGTSSNRNESSQDASLNGIENQNSVNQQFVIELYWCIQQLESQLSNGKLNEKQAETAKKALKVLKSTNQPLIKKRQLMSQVFGDYRSKMVEEEKKFSLSKNQIKFNPNCENGKSYFIKKSTFMESDKNFKFNFDVTKAGVENLKIDEKEKEENHNLSKNILFTSDNNFKFNFSVE